MELWHSFKRIKDFQLIIHFIMVSIFTFIKYGLLGYSMALDTTFGDGTPISFREMNEIRRAIHKNMVYSRWQKGDILCIDNFSTSHGRQPTYDRSRQVVVAWSHPLDKYQASNSTSTTLSVVELLVDSKTLDDVPELAESPENSPSTTLTKEEAQELKDLFLTDRFEAQMAMAFSKREETKKAGLHKRLSSCPTLLQSVFDSEGVSLSQ
jgi:hypothetical protein